MLSLFSFAEIIIVVLDSAVTQFNKILPNICSSKLKLDIVTIPDDEDLGTADALRHIKDKIEVRFCMPFLLSNFPSMVFGLACYATKFFCDAANSLLH